MEPDKDFRVALSNPAKATIIDAEGDATILNDDGDICGWSWGDPHYRTFDGPMISRRLENPSLSSRRMIAISSVRPDDLDKWRPGGDRQRRQPLVL